jgi:hypothetical protein
LICFLNALTTSQEVDDDLQSWSEKCFPSHPLVLIIAMDVSQEPLPSPRQPTAALNCREAPDRKYRVLEMWNICYESTAGQPGRPREIKPAEFVKQLVLLVRTVHSCLRMLPCHQTVAKVC